MFTEIAQFIFNNPWWATNILFVALLVFFEILTPLKPAQLFSWSSAEDIFWLCCTTLVSMNIWVIINYKLSDYFSRALAGKNINLEYQPIVLQFLVFFILTDFINFLAHRCLHKNDYLWKFHQLHHSTESIKTFSAFRHHWLEDLYYSTWTTALTSLFIANPNVRLVTAIFFSFLCYFQHANLKIKWRIWGEIFIGPLNHRWHHSLISFKQKGQNFGLFLTIWDRLFDSYYVQKEEPSLLGTSSDYPKTLTRRLLYPFIK